MIPTTKLEDIYAGLLELTSRERSYLAAALIEYYMQGAQNFLFTKGEDKLDFGMRVGAKLGAALKLTQMVTPDGTRLVSVEEHGAIVAKLSNVTSTHDWQPTATWFACSRCGVEASAPHAGVPDENPCPGVEKKP